MYRSNHPVYGNDPDIPGGTLEEGELPLDALVREVDEETRVVVTPTAAKEVYSGTNYSAGGTCYILYTCRFDHTPKITMSWEHSAYEWLDRNEFLAKANSANDTYMHMVYDVLK